MYGAIDPEHLEYMLTGRWPDGGEDENEEDLDELIAIGLELSSFELDLIEEATREREIQLANERYDAEYGPPDEGTNYRDFAPVPDCFPEDWRDL